MLTTYGNLFVFLFVSILTVFRAQTPPPQTSKTIPPSVYAFGDSFVDTGNNNYIEKRVARSNFPPYGRDFLNGTATGRFSNGLLLPDLLAKYVGGPEYSLAYLDPTLDLHLMEPVAAISFGSATTGYDSATTNKSNAIPMSTQLEYFKEYKAKLQKLKGNEEAEEQIENAIFYVNAGSDDIAFVFFGDGKAHTGQRRYMAGEYQDLILNFTDTFVQGLTEQGATKIAVTGLPPLGCVPVAITMLPSAYPQAMPATRKCFEMGNTFSNQFNQKLRNRINQTSYAGVKIGYIDFELPLLEVIQNPDRYGYEEVDKGCCGTGFYEIGFSCNSTVAVCGDVSKYVFWDAAHPTEKTYRFVFSSNLETIDQLI